MDSDNNPTTAPTPNPTYLVEVVKTEVVIENGRMARVVQHFRVTGGVQAGEIVRIVSAEGTYTVET